MTPDSGAAEKLLHQIARGIDLLVALQIQQIRGDRSTTDTIQMLAKLGATAPEIMRVLGAPRNTVAPIVSRAKSAAREGGRKAARRRPRKRR
jgi:hypothetical protein